MAVHQKRPAVFVAEAKSKANTENLDTESSESELEFDEDDEVRQSEPSENAIYNREGLLDKLGDISWPENVDWIHKLSFDVNQEQEVDANDDLTRELVFYTQALEGTKEAFLKFQSMGRPFLTPTDYNGAMVKNDTHLEKVKDQLLAEKNRVEEAEERRKARESEKIAKEAQAQKFKEKAKQEKEEKKSAKKLIKERQESGISEPEEDGDIGLADEDDSTFDESDHSEGKAKEITGKGKKEADKRRKNRDYRNSKHGLGVKKGIRKQNKAETTNDTRRGFKSTGFAKNKRRKT